MLKSTHKPRQPPPPPPPLPQGWTEHTALTGHSYFYHAQSGQSTYTRPIEQPQPPPPIFPSPSSSWVNPSYNNSSNGFAPQNAYDNNLRGRGGFHRGRGRGDHHGHGKPRQDDKPKHRYKIPGCAPWILVKTKLGRRFVHNSETNESFWKFPEHVMKGVVELDRIEREKKARRERGEPSDDEAGEDEQAIAAEMLAAASRVEGDAQGASYAPPQRDAGESSDEYEEVEVTDDEEEDEEGGPSKRPRTESQGPEDPDQPVEFGEDDIAHQLAAMGAEYDLDPEDYDGGGEWDQGEGGLELTEEDATALFRDLLDDFRINPFTPFDSVIENGAIIDDDRYVALPNMNARRRVYDIWSGDKIHELKKRREAEEKRDPRLPYIAFLDQKARSAKLYWPEFKRAHRKEEIMRTTKFSDKDREKLYREHMKRLVLSQATLKSDLAALMKSLPLKSFNCSTTLATLPIPLIVDLRFISLAPSIRDPLVEAFISTLPPAPTESDNEEEEEDEEVMTRKAERDRREQALRERENKVEEERRRQRRELGAGKAMLREEEREIQEAMRRGLRGDVEMGRA
ncbi:hypothetical protein K402DRAFT_448869 [Aulographum hederae CBS 113979]|uniref:WW domain-containing protein n=1 Tax=Aulographum hederae CBS 113979 TaxID=1176131 RepID=A0A6G1GMU0_9PEZI|nr:hypothetical protein K402DRAFT_448869 [Aulographum hederae CBS 113979]